MKNFEELKQEADENLRKFEAWMSAFNYACEKAGITEEQGTKFFDAIGEKLREQD